MTVNEVMPIILYILGSILLVTLIVLTVELIMTMNKINKIVDNISGKVSSLDELFKVIGTVTGRFAVITDKIVDGAASIIERIFKGKDEKIEWVKMVLENLLLEQA